MLYILWNSIIWHSISLWLFPLCQNLTNINYFESGNNALTANCMSSFKQFKWTSCRGSLGGFSTQIFSVTLTTFSLHERKVKDVDLRNAKYICNTVLNACKESGRQTIVAVWLRFVHIGQLTAATVYTCWLHSVPSHLPSLGLCGFALVVKPQVCCNVSWSHTKGFAWPDGFKKIWHFFYTMVIVCKQMQT